MCDQQGLRSACAYAQSGQSLCLSLECSVTVGLLTGRRLGFLCLGGGGGGGGGGGLCGFVWVCACRKATLLEITCHGSSIIPSFCKLVP